MKGYFVSLLLAVALLAFQGVAAADNLQLILEGPFVVCENTDGKTLTIALPDLHDTHYVPGFIGSLDDLPLGTGKHGDKYHVPGDQVAIAIHAKGWPDNNSHPMMLNPRRIAGQDPVAYFYSESSYCDGHLKTNLASITFTVPFPDQVWATHPTDGYIAITDNKGNYKGECEASTEKTHFCRYATRLVLRYLGVDLKTLEIDTTCNKTVNGKCTNYDKWLPDASAAIGGEFEIVLSAEPKPSKNAKKHKKDHAQEAFWKASELAGVDSYLEYPKGRPVENVISHAVCQIPTIVLCQHKETCPTM